MKTKIVSYFTPNYVNHMERFKDSLARLGLKAEVEKMRQPPTLNTPNGRWIWGTQQKPAFIRSHLERSDGPVAWVDIDGEFIQRPALFDEVEADFAATVWVHPWRRSSAHPSRPPELLTGTMLFLPTDGAIALLKAWEKLCLTNPLVSSQRLLHTLVRVGYLGTSLLSPLCTTAVLPEPYCSIIDVMADCGDPVILHHQASRKARRSST